MITCRKCGLEKDPSEFFKRAASPTGHHPHCKPCVRLYKAEYRSRPDVIEAIRAYDRRPEAVARRKAYKKPVSTPEQLAKRRALAKTPEAIARRREYLSRPNVHERVLAKRRARYHEKYKHDVAKVLDGRLRVLIRRSLKTGKNNQSWRDLVDFTLEEFRSNMERQFTDGMTWELLLAGEIEIDHIIPVSSFKIAGPECPEFKACWCLGNLRPLWKRENNVKRNKIFFLV